MDKKVIGKKITELRKSHNISQKQLAEILGFESDTAIYLIEKGDRALSLEKLLTLKKYFGLNLNIFLDFENPEIVLVNCEIPLNKPLIFRRTKNNNIGYKLLN